jgi:TetR/AcrR family fatty acid metabolism transcriptional regulator
MERFTASWLGRYFDLVGSVIEQGQREGSLRADVPRKLVTKAFFGTLDELVTSWVIGRKDYDLALLAGPAVDLLLRGAAPASASAPGRRTLSVAAGRGGR